EPQALPAPNVVVNGRLEKDGDVDVFAVELRKGQTLVASLTAYSVLRSPMDGVLQILSPDGFVLAQDDDFHELDPQIVFPVPKDGRYLVRVFAFPAVPTAAVKFAGGDKFIYRLTLTTGAFADYAFPLATWRFAPGETRADLNLVGWNLPDGLQKLSLDPIPGTDLATASHPDLANTV